MLANMDCNSADIGSQIERLIVIKLNLFMDTIQLPFEPFQMNVIVGLEIFA